MLVVEDHEPFRRIVCALLRRRPDVLVVGESADGLDAIRQAESLRPDVVLLDIGLPGMSGIDVATRLRVTLPATKLILVTVESSFEIVQQGFRRGVHGYVYKPRAQRDLLLVFEAVIRGGRFVSGGLERIARGDGLASHSHRLLFCSNDEILLGACSRFIGGVLDAGNAVIALVTDSHDQGLRRSMEASDVDVALAIRQQRYVPLSIDDLLAKVMVNGWPDTTRFVNATQDVLGEAERRATGAHAKVAACCECAPTVWARGQVDAAIQLEHLWDEVAAGRQINLLCAYPLAVGREHMGSVRSLCAEHTLVEVC